MLRRFQPIATRVDGALYCVHSDHLGSTVAVSDAAGGEVGRVLYDPYGEVLTSTLPVTLTEQLLSSQGLDSQLGLVYHGDGRYYDPAIAHTLQPDPFGGVPQLPQTLNRYAVPVTPSALSATSCRSSGMGIGNWVESLVLNTGKAVAGQYLYHPLWRRASQAYWDSYISITRYTYQRRLAWELLPANKTADEALGLGYLAVGWLRSKAPRGSWAALAADLAESQLDIRLAKNTRWAAQETFEEVVEHSYHVAPLGRLAGWLAYSRYGKAALDLGIGFGIDVGVQALLDAPMLYRGELTWGQYGGRLAVAGAGSAISWALGVGAGALVVAVLGAPIVVAGATALVVGVTANVAYDVLAAPWLFEKFKLNPGTR